jgi:hypothetical protein
VRSRWTGSDFFFSFELSYLRAFHNGLGCQDLEGGLRYAQKALEVRSPLVQNGRDDHQPDCGDIPLESAAIGRLNGDIGNWTIRVCPGGANVREPHLNEALRAVSVA